MKLKHNKCICQQLVDSSPVFLKGISLIALGRVFNSAQYLIQGTLDYMDNLAPQQIRRLFHLLSRLAFGQQQRGAHIQVHVHNKIQWFCLTPVSPRLIIVSLTDPTAFSVSFPGWHAHSDPQTALQHCAQIQAYRHHRCCHDHRQHGSIQVRAVTQRHEQKLLVHFVALCLDHALCLLTQA